MRIIAFANRDSGPAFHRIIMPLMLMKDVDVYVTNDLKVEDFEKGCDIFMYNRILPAHAMDQVRQLQVQYGFKICVDVDDYWELDPHHILFDSYQEDGFARQQVEHIRGADIVFTTHDRLATAIEDAIGLGRACMDARLPFNLRPSVHVLPNAIPKQGQFDPALFALQRMTSPFTRLFWQGSITHHPDIEILKPAIDRLASISGKIKMIMAGYQEKTEAWNYMARLYTSNLKHRYKLIPGAHVTSYYAAYLEADICLVPLVNSPFNRMKSNLKILEAGNLGLPVIASGVHPYLDMPVSYCKHPRDWVGHIKRLVQWPERRKEEGQRLAEFCSEHYNFHKINNERRQILEYVAQKARA